MWLYKQVRQTKQNIISLLVVFLLQKGNVIQISITVYIYKYQKLFKSSIDYNNNQSMSQFSSSQQSPMMALVDKLCDHLPNQRIKLLIDNGFDEWQTVTYMKGPQLIQLGFDCDQVIAILVAINANAKTYQGKQIFTQQQVQEIVKLAKQNDEDKLKEIEKEEEEYKRNVQRKIQNEQRQRQEKEQGPHDINIKQYPQKVLTESLMVKCIPGQKLQKPTDKTPLHKVTLLQLQGKQITHLSQQQLRKIPSIQNLYLANNHIYRIQGLSSLTKIKILRLQNNLIKKIEGLQQLINLQILTMNQNYLQRIENLHCNKKLHQLYISNQKHTFPVIFEQQSFQALAYCLQKLQCNNNYVKNIQTFRHLAVVQQVSLKNNLLQDISQLTGALTQMQRIKKIDFRGNPITKVAKYRDYIVILSKSLEQLDDKKILPKEREYLVKLYSLKHAKQQKEVNGIEPNRKNTKLVNNFNLQGVKVDEQQLGSHQHPMYVHGGDLRGNVTRANTKVIRK